MARAIEIDGKSGLHFRLKMSHILNISTHYIESKSYICIPEMIRNSEKLMNLNFEIRNCSLITLMMVIKDSIKFVNKINFNLIKHRDVENIIDFYSKMEYPVDIIFPGLTEHLLTKIVEMPKRIVQKRLLMIFSRFSEIHSKAISILKPTIIYLRLHKGHEIMKFLNVLENTRIKSIYLILWEKLDGEISFDFTKYPNLEKFIAAISIQITKNIAKTVTETTMKKKSIAKTVTRTTMKKKNIVVVAIRITKLIIAANAENTLILVKNIARNVTRFILDI